MVDDVKMVKYKMLEKGATHAQTGHFYVQNKPQSDNQGNSLYVQFLLQNCKLHCNKQKGPALVKHVIYFKSHNRPEPRF